MPATGSPTPARAIKLLKAPWRKAAPLYTALTGRQGKKTCLVSELLSRGAAPDAQMPGARRVGRERGEQGLEGRVRWWRAGPGKEPGERVSGRHLRGSP